MIQTNPGNQPPPSKGKKIVLYLIFGAVCTVACLSLWRVWTAPYVPAAKIRDSVEKVLNDTVIYRNLTHTQSWTDSNVNAGDALPDSAIAETYCVCIGLNAGAYLTTGKYDIVVSDKGVVLWGDASYVFLVDWDCKYLKKHHKLKAYLRHLNYIFYRVPGAKYSPFLRKKIYYDIVNLMAKDRRDSL